MFVLSFPYLCPDMLRRYSSKRACLQLGRPHANRLPVVLSALHVALANPDVQAADPRPVEPPAADPVDADAAEAVS